jgi:hypothetical protein
LDFHTSSKNGAIEIDIYIKAAAMSSTINSTSCRPGEHELATFRNGIYRLYRLPLSKENETQEFNIIVNIAENNVIRKN